MKNVDVSTILNSVGVFICKGVFVTTFFVFRHASRAAWLLPPILLLSVVIAGCSSDQVKQLTDQVSKQAEQVTKKASETVQQIAPQVQDALASGPTGEATFQLDSTVSIQNAFGRLLILKPDRKNVLQVRSYRVESDENFPSFLFQAQTETADIQACVGQSLEGQLFIQVSEDGPIWSTTDSDRITMKILELTDGELVAEVDGKLENQAGEKSEVKGNLRIAHTMDSAEVLP